MRFLADMNVSLSTAQGLSAEGYDAVHLREQGLERLPDTAIIDKARREGRIIVTFDLDFGDLLAAGGLNLPSVIIFRLSDETPATVTHRLIEAVRLKSDELEKGAIVIVEDARYRTRLLPVLPIGEEW